MGSDTLLLNEINEHWQQCKSDVQREIIWTHLTGQHGLWFQCFREIANPAVPLPASLTGLIEAWLEAGDANSPAWFCKSGFAPYWQFKLLQVCYQYAVLVRTASGALPSASQIQHLADNAELPSGLGFGLVRHIAGMELKPATSNVEIVVLLVNDMHAGVPAKLRLERLAEGTGSLYPTPWLSLCRDQAFMTSERLAAGPLSDTPGIDVRWDLQRLDGKPLGHLTGMSMGGAFSLGLCSLINSPVDFEPAYLAGVAVASSLSVTGKYTRVGALWDKLDPEAIQLASLHTLIVSPDQSDIPPRYLNLDSPFMVLKPHDAVDALQQLLQNSLPWRAIRRYERDACKSLEFRLSGTAAPIESHYQVVPLYRVIESVPADKIHQQTRGNINTAQAGVILRWEDAIRRKARHYEPVTLNDVVTGAAHSGNNTAPRLLVMGSPGSGKTTFIQYLAWAAATDKVFNKSMVPARIRIKDWERWTLSNPETRLPDFLQAHYRSLVKEAPGSDTWNDWLRHGRVVLLLDGVDEIEDEAWFRNMLEDLLDYRDTMLVLTIRTVAFRLHKPQFETISVYWLGPLQKTQRDAYIQTYPARHEFDRIRLIEHLDSNPALQSFGENPLLLSMICFAMDDPAQPELPQTRAALYDRFVDHLLTRPERVRIDYPGEPPSARQKKRALAHVALHLLGQQRFSFTSDDLIHALGSALEEMGYGSAPAPWANALGKDLVANSALLRGYRNSTNTRDHMQFFLHAMIHEYLSACALALLLTTGDCDSKIDVAGKSCSIRALVSEIAWTDSNWAEVVELLGELLDSDDIHLIN